MRQRRDWQLTDAAADRFVADLEAAVRHGHLVRQLAERREARARLGLPDVRPHALRNVS